MALRWCATGMVEPGKQFCRGKGHRHLPALHAVLQAAVPTAPIHADDLSPRAWAYLVDFPHRGLLEPPLGIRG
jgi:hypothetical protein